MRLSIPALILAVFGSLAAVTAIGGGWMARRDTIIRQERDRGSQEQLAAELTTEIRRLESLYEAHLRTLLLRAETDGGPGFATAGRNIKGVLHFSRLSSRAGPADLHLDLRPLGAPAFQPPSFPDQRGVTPVGRREIQPTQIFSTSPESLRWIREPRRPALCFTTQGDTAFILTINEDEVRSAMNGSLRAWLPFAPIAQTVGGDRVIGPDKSVLAQTAIPEIPPDWVSPVTSSFGTWRIESWDVRAPRREWHLPTLVGAFGSAAILAIAGLTLAVRVHRERQRMEQRVSFVNRVSHELRTPLTNMLLHLDLASEQVDDARTNGRLDLVREEARRLGRLIENVLTFSRRERDAQMDSNRARPTSPASILHDALDQFAPAFARRGITVERRIPICEPCLLDPDALAQIAANLFSNAEKYASQGPLVVSLSVEHGTLHLIVSDSGPGIPSAAAERIFVPFERLHSRTTEGVTGTGLGLTIARELAQRMGGQLHLRPSAKGATFELIVPAPSVPQIRASSSAA